MVWMTKELWFGSHQRHGDFFLQSVSFSQPPFHWVPEAFCPVTNQSP